MHRMPLFALLLLAATSAAALDAPRRPEPIVPDTLHWTSPPGNPQLKAAWVLGSETATGTYVLRVLLAKGGRIAPHTHPDARYTTVLSGTLHVGFGDAVDDADLVAVPAGAVYVVPAGMPHTLFAPDGDVSYQEAGTGPTATQPVAPEHK